MDCVNTEVVEIQTLALTCIAEAMTCEPNRSSFVSSDLLSKLTLMFESAQPITVTAKLLNVFSVLFEDSSALESIDVTTIIPRILHIATNYAEDVGPIYDGTGKTNRTRTAQGSSRRIRSKTTTKRDPNLEKSYLPEIQCNCCKILQKISQYEKYTQILILNGVEKRLLDLLSKTSDISVQIAAARAISVCARNNSVQLRLTSLGGVGEFARLLKIDNSESRSTALAALAQLTRENAIACRELKRAPNTLPQLVACLKGPEVDVLNALSIVSELSNDDKAREDLHHFDIVPSIVEALSSE
uniref:CTLH domain-containing protein n=1 Tax=Mesocestoides corti TaxID=53468 RepID=A0A5K3FC73_MESCO